MHFYFVDRAFENAIFDSTRLPIDTLNQNRLCHSLYFIFQIDKRTRQCRADVICKLQQIDPKQKQIQIVHQAETSFLPQR